jgi:hypothetical protein
MREFGCFRFCPEGDLRDSRVDQSQTAKKSEIIDRLQPGFFAP